MDTTELSRCPTCGEECFVAHGDVYVGMGSERKCLEFHADYRRVVEWIKDRKRKMAALAFTSGPERQIAYAIEEMRILEGPRRKKRRAKA